jgi:hypothetical protein
MTEYVAGTFPPSPSGHLTHKSTRNRGIETCTMGTTDRFSAERHRYRRRLMERAGLVANDDRRDNQRSPLPEPCLRHLDVVPPPHLVHRAQGFAGAINRELSVGDSGPVGDDADRVAVTIHFIRPVLEELSPDHIDLPPGWEEWQLRWATGETL